MIVTSTNTVRTECLALALAIAVRHAKDSFLSSIRVHVMQTQPRDGLPAYADPACLSGSFLFRVTLKGSEKIAGNVHVLDENRLAKGCAKLAAVDPAAFARIMAGTPRIADAIALLQYALFGYERF